MFENSLFLAIYLELTTENPNKKTGYKSLKWIHNKVWLQGDHCNNNRRYNLLPSQPYWLNKANANEKQTKNILNVQKILALTQQEKKRGVVKYDTCHRQPHNKLLAISFFSLKKTIMQKFSKPQKKKEESRLSLIKQFQNFS